MLGCSLRGGGGQKSCFFALFTFSCSKPILRWIRWWCSVLAFSLVSVPSATIVFSGRAIRVSLVIWAKGSVQLVSLLAVVCLRRHNHRRKNKKYSWVEPHVSELWFEPWALHSFWHWWQFDASLCRTRQCKNKENQWYMFVSPLSILLSPFLIHTLTYMFILHGTWAKMAWAKMVTDQYIYTYAYIHDTFIYIYIYIIMYTFIYMSSYPVQKVTPVAN